MQKVTFDAEVTKAAHNAAQRTIIMQQAKRAQKIEGKANEKTAEADSEHLTETE